MLIVFILLVKIFISTILYKMTTPDRRIYYIGLRYILCQIRHWNLLSVERIYASPWWTFLRIDEILHFSGLPCALRTHVTTLDKVVSGIISSMLLHVRSRSIDATSILSAHDTIHNEWIQCNEHGCRNDQSGIHLSLTSLSFILRLYRSFQSLIDFVLDCVFLWTSYVEESR